MNASLYSALCSARQSPGQEVRAGWLAGIRSCVCRNYCAVAIVTAWMACSIALAAEVPAGDAGERRFDVHEYAVDGNTVLEPAVIQEALAPWLGLEKTVKDVDNAREALQSLYRSRGFQTVSVAIAAASRKTVADGLIVFQVDEGRIHKLTVSGARYFSVDDIRAAVPSLREGQIPDFNAVQKELAALDRQRDRQVVPSINRNDATGDLDIDLAVTDTLPLHGQIEFNNRYSNGTSHTRASAMLSYDNMWQRGDSLSLMMQTAPERPDDDSVLFASYLARFADPGFTLQLTTLKTESDVSSVGGTNIIGRGEAFGVKGNWQQPGTDGWYYGMSAGVEYKDFINKVQLGNSSLDSPLAYAPFTLSMTAGHRDETQSMRYGLDWMMTVPGLGSDTRTIDLSRYGASRRMRALRASAGVDFELPKAYRLSFSGSAQTTDVPLVSNEQISAGGMDSVRGFLEAESAGDHGVLLSGELQSPPLVSFLPDSAWVRHLGDGHAYLFADSARLALQGTLPDATQSRDSELHSAGAGVTFTCFTHLNAVLEWGIPLVDGAYTQKNDSRLLFRVWGTF